MSLTNAFRTNLAALARGPSRMGQVAMALAATLPVAALLFLVGGAAPVLVVAAAAAPLAAVLALRMPFLLCLSFIVLSFFRIHEVFPVLEPLKLPKLVALGTLFALLGQALTGRFRPFWRVEMTWLTIFFVHVTIGMFFSVGRPIAIAYWSDTYSKIFLMVLAIAFVVTSWRHFAVAGTAFIAAGIAVSAVAISNSLNGVGLVEGTRVTIGREAGSVLGDPNDLSLVLLFPASFSLCWATSKNVPWPYRAIGIVGLVLIIWAILCTQSRGGLFGLVAGFAVVGARAIRSKALLASIAVVLVAGLFAVAGISGRSSGGAAESGIDESAQGRLYAWEAAVNMALDHPFIGVGIDNFRYNFFQYTPHWDGLAKAVHSTWFGVLAESGFVGFIVFIVLVTLTVKLAFRTMVDLEKARDEGADHNPMALATARALPAGIAGFVVSGSFLTQGYTWPLYILLALTLAMARYAELHRTPQPGPDRPLPLRGGRSGPLQDARPPLDFGRRTQQFAQKPLN